MSNPWEDIPLICKKSLEHLLPNGKKLVQMDFESSI